jgi:hypothetical protein
LHRCQGADAEHERFARATHVDPPTEGNIEGGGDAVRDSNLTFCDPSPQFVDFRGTARRDRTQPFRVTADCIGDAVTYRNAADIDDDRSCCTNRLT